MSQLQERFEKHDHFARHSGITLLKVAPGYAKAAMKINDTHLNSLKTVHGGAVFTLADFVFAVASNSHDVPVTSINCSISFVKAVSSGTLTAEAKELSVRTKLAHYDVTVTDEAGEIVALFHGLGYKLSPRQ